LFHKKRISDENDLILKINLLKRVSIEKEKTKHLKKIVVF
jgi:hypothetical protein